MMIKTPLCLLILAPSILFAMDRVENNAQLINDCQLLSVKAFLNEKFKSSYEPTTFEERKTYGYHGIKIPVFLYTLDADTQIDETAGCIIKDARPTTWYGLRFDANAIPVDRVFLKTPVEKAFRAQILERANRYVAFRASCLLAKENMTSIFALLWVDYLNDRKIFLTLSDLGSLQWDDPLINLDENKQQIG